MSAEAPALSPAAHASSHHSVASDASTAAASLRCFATTTDGRCTIWDRKADFENWSAGGNDNGRNLASIFNIVMNTKDWYYLIHPAVDRKAITWDGLIPIWRAPDCCIHAKAQRREGPTGEALMPAEIYVCEQLQLERPEKTPPKDSSSPRFSHPNQNWAANAPSARSTRPSHLLH